MGRTGPKPETLAKVAAAQRLVDKDIPVAQACAQVGISPSAFRRNGGRSRPSTQQQIPGRKNTGAGATARDQAMAAALGDSHAPGRRLGDAGTSTTDGDSVLRVNDTSTGIEMAVAAAACDAMSPGGEEIIASRRGLLTIRRPHDQGDRFAFEYMDWAADPAETHSCTMTVGEIDAALADADVDTAEGMRTA